MSSFRDTSSRWSRGMFLALLALGVLLTIPWSRHALEYGVGRVLAQSSRFVWMVRSKQDNAGDKRLQETESRFARLVAGLARIEALEEENALLRKQIQYVPDSGFELLGAQVLSRLMTPDRAVITIDRGAMDSIEIGQAVLADEGVVVGKVARLFERSALVELMTDPRSRFAASIQGEKRLLGVVEGRGNGAARMTYIPASQTIKKDAMIVTSGTEEKIPPHIALGLVNAVEGASTDPFVSAVLEPLIPLDRLQLVRVLRPTRQPATTRPSF